MQSYVKLEAHSFVILCCFGIDIVCLSCFFEMYETDTLYALGYLDSFPSTITSFIDQYLLPLLSIHCKAQWIIYMIIILFCKHHLVPYNSFGKHWTVRRILACTRSGKKCYDTCAPHPHPRVPHLPLLRKERYHTNKMVELQDNKMQLIFNLKRTWQVHLVLMRRLSF
jgi:hypothetical protein